MLVMQRASNDDDAHTSLHRRQHGQFKEEKEKGEVVTRSQTGAKRFHRGQSSTGRKLQSSTLRRMHLPGCSFLRKSNWFIRTRADPQQTFFGHK